MPAARSLSSRRRLFDWIQELLLSISILRILLLLFYFSSQFNQFYHRSPPLDLPARANRSTTTASSNRQIDHHYLISPTTTDIEIIKTIKSSSSSPGRRRRRRACRRHLTPASHRRRRRARAQRNRQQQQANQQTRSTIIARIGNQTRIMPGIALASASVRRRPSSHCRSVVLRPSRPAARPI